MNELIAVLFAVKLLFFANVPLEIGLAVYEEAEQARVDPNALAAVLVTEHRGDYPVDHRSRRGAMGLFQLSPIWARNDKIDTQDVAVEDLYDWRVNTMVAARAVHYMIWRHASRCRRGDHTWLAHYKCARRARSRCRPARRAEKVYRRLCAWSFEEGLQRLVWVLVQPVRLLHRPSLPPPLVG